MPPRVEPHHLGHAHADRVEGSLVCQRAREVEDVPLAGLARVARLPLGRLVTAEEVPGPRDGRLEEEVAPEGVIIAEELREQMVLEADRHAAVRARSAAAGLHLQRRKHRGAVDPHDVAQRAKQPAELVPCLHQHRCDRAGRGGHHDLHAGRRLQLDLL